MNVNITNIAAQQSEDTSCDNGQPSDDDTLVSIYGDFNSAAAFLNSLDGRLAAERDKLLAQDLSNEVVADRILALQQEAESLRFTAGPAGSGGALSITASVTSDFGEKPLDVDKFDPSNATNRNRFAERLAALHPAIKAPSAERQLMEFAIELADSRKENPPTALPTSEELLQQTPESVRTAAQEMLKAPNLMDKIIADVQALGVAGEEDLIATIYLAGTSRLLPEPVKVIVSSHTSTGKTITVRHTTRCFPPEQVIHANSITPQALYYMGRRDPNALKHKLVVTGERKKDKSEGQADATSAIRQMLSDGQISKLFTDTSANPPVTELVVINGPISFIETTTSVAADIFGEDLNRCLLLSADERPDQTRRVIKHIAATKCGSKIIDVDAIVELHQTTQRMLQQRPVAIPFAESLADNFHCERPEARRAFGQLCGMIEASALLHQFQRQIDVEGRIIATFADYRIAAALCRSPLARLLGGKISDAAIRFHERLQKWAGGQQFTTTEALKKDNKTRQAVYPWLVELASIDAVMQMEPGKGSKPAEWKLTGMPHADVAEGGFQLPTEAELEENQLLEVERQSGVASEPQVNALDINTSTPTYAGFDRDAGF